MGQCLKLIGQALELGVGGTLDEVSIGADERPGMWAASRSATTRGSEPGGITRSSAPPITPTHGHALPLKVASDDSTADQVFDDGQGLEAERLALSETVAGMEEKFPDVKVQMELALGLPDERLVRPSAAMDMVVVGGHPRSRLGTLLYMNVGRWVVEHAKCIVAIVPSGP